MSSIHPFQGNLGTLVKDKPDFYGPIWYLITLVFCLSVLSNFSHYLAYIFGTGSRDPETQRAMAVFKFSYLLKALAVCFGSYALAPLTFLLGLVLLGKVPNGIQVAELYCIWGYSYIFYIFAAIVATFPVSVAFIYLGDYILCVFGSSSAGLTDADDSTQQLPLPVYGQREVLAAGAGWRLAGAYLLFLPLRFLLIK